MESHKTCACCSQWFLSAVIHGEMVSKLQVLLGLFNVGAKTVRSCCTCVLMLSAESLHAVCSCAFLFFFFFLRNVGQHWSRFRTGSGHGAFSLVLYCMASYGNSIQSCCHSHWPTFLQEVSLSKHKNSKYSDNNSQLYILAMLKCATNSRLNGSDVSFTLIYLHSTLLLLKSTTKKTKPCSIQI